MNIGGREFQAVGKARMKPWEVKEWQREQWARAGCTGAEGREMIKLSHLDTAR